MLGGWHTWPKILRQRNILDDIIVHAARLKQCPIYTPDHIRTIPGVFPNIMLLAVYSNSIQNNTIRKYSMLIYSSDHFKYSV